MSVPLAMTEPTRDVATPDGDAVLGVLADAVFMVDGDDCLRYGNPAAEQFFDDLGSHRIFRSTLAKRSNASPHRTKAVGICRDRDEKNPSNEDLLHWNLNAGDSQRHLKNPECGSTDQGSHDRTAATFQVIATDNGCGKSRQ